MNRRLMPWLGLMGLASMLTGCDYAPSRPPVLPTSVVSGPLPSAPGRPREQVLESPDAQKPFVAELTPEAATRREIILANFIKLIDTAALNPGGPNFANATDNLNDFFAQGNAPGDFDYPPRSRDFLMRKIFDLSQQDPEPIVKSFCTEKFVTRDARHIEDCMLYRAVANRVSGEGDDLTRVRRIFDWTVRNILLVPPESLSAGGFPQAQVRPADVLYRGMATEGGGRWSERGWLFMSLCRQIGIDVGILTYTTKPSLLATPAAAANRPVTIWICAAVVNEKCYLFDQRIGIEIPGPDGKGVATLEEAITDPTILARLDMPGLSNYSGATAAELAGSPSKIGVLIDSSQGYLATRMRQLQGQLRGDHRTVLFRDPLEQGRNFSKALGTRLGLVSFWDLPVRVEQALFTDSNFVAATQASLQFFDSRYPLLNARTAQLRGDLVDATNQYVALRLRTDAVMKDKDKTPIPPEIQRALDIYATFFLAQCQFDLGNPKLAEDMYRQLIALSPEPGPGRYYYYMLRWGALSNLGRLLESRGDRAGAIAYYSHNNRTFQSHGNLIRARNLIWNQPFDEPIAPLPEAPPVPAAELKAAVEDAQSSRSVPHSGKMP